MSSRQSKWLKTLKGKTYTKKYLEKNKKRIKEKQKEIREKRKQENPDYHKEYYKKNKPKVLLRIKHFRSTGIRRWSKKGQCPHYNNKTGSYHNKKCPLAFLLPEKQRCAKSQ